MEEEKRRRGREEGERRERERKIGKRREESNSQRKKVPIFLCARLIEDVFTKSIWSDISVRLKLELIRTSRGKIFLE